MMVMRTEKKNPAREDTNPAANKPESQLFVLADTIMAMIAPNNIFPSRPILTIPPSLLISPPIAARSIGVVSKTPDARIFSTNCIIFFSN